MKNKLSGFTPFGFLVYKNSKTHFYPGITLNSRNQGFTLIELLVVIAIITLLSSVIFASVSISREKARLAGAMKFEANTISTISTDLVARYDFEGGSGGNGTKIVDRSGNGNDGVVVGVGTSWITDTYNQDKSKFAMSFSGTDKVTIAKPFGISNSNFTMTEWIRTTDNLAQAYTISNAGGGNGFRFGLGNGNVAFLIGNGTLYKEMTCPNSRKANDGAWHNIAVVFDRSNLKVKCYIDGILTGTIALPSNYPDMFDGGNTQIGKPPAGANFTGSLDDVRIYGSNLDGVAIEKIYNDTKDIYLAEGVRDKAN